MVPVGGCGTVAAAAVGKRGVEAPAGVGVWVATAAAHTPAGDTGALGSPEAGTNRKPSASPSCIARAEMPTLASCQEAPDLATNTAQ